MKRIVYTIAIVMSLSGAAAVAAETPSREEALARWQAIAEQLALTEEQKEQIAPIVKQQAIDLKAVHDNTALRPRHKVKRARAISESASTKIRALLTPEQQVKYDTLREEQKARMREQFQQRRQDRTSEDTAAEN
jgi:hypothetical protein